MSTFKAPQSASTGSSTPAPAGNHVGRCVEMIQVGTLEKEFKGEKKLQHIIRLTWELPYEMREAKEGEEAKPFLVSKNYTFSMYEMATFRKHLAAWRGKDWKTQAEADEFDPGKLLGVPCMVSVTHKESQKGNTYAEVSGLGAMPKGMSCPDQINTTRALSYNDFNWVTYNSLPDFIKNDIQLTPEFKALKKPEPVAQPSQAAAQQQAVGAMVADDDNDLPF